MRVLHVVPSLARRTGGPAVSVVESARALRSIGVEACVFSTDMAGPAAATDRGRRVLAPELVDGAAEAGVRLFRARPPYRLAYSPALGRALRSDVSSYDLVHIHSVFLYPQFAAARAARRANVPYVVAPRGALDPWLRQRGRVRKGVNDALWQRRMLERAAALHVTSPGEEQATADVARGVPRIVIPNGIDWSHFQDIGDGAEFRRRFLGGSDGRLVLNVGRIAAKKALDVLIRAFSRVAADAPDAWLAIVGPDDEGMTPELRVLADAQGFGDRVVFTGLLYGDDKLGALAAADVWALPSHTENFGVAVAEALAAGLPVVVSPGVNIAAEVAAAGAAVVADGEPEALARALIDLLGDPMGARALGERARSFARRYDWGIIGPQLAHAYEGIL